MSSDASVPHVIAHIDRYVVAFPADQVVEMVSIPSVSPVPSLPPTIRGMIRVRDALLPLIDTRYLFGLSSCRESFEDLTAMLQTRRQEHEAWLTELEASVTEGRPFTLATDPTRCAFGRWYATFHTDHHQLAAHMQAFDEPHRAIHRIAGEVLELAESGQQARALALIEQTRTDTLAKLILLFSGAESLIRDAFKEIAVLMEVHGRSFAIAVDSVETLETFEASALEPATQHGMDGATGLVAFARRASGPMVLVLDPGVLATTAGIGSRELLETA